MLKKITIVSSEVLRSGNSDKGPWTLYKINSKDDEDQEFVFKDFGRHYKWEQLIGKSVQLNFEERVNGQFRDFFIADSRKKTDTQVDNKLDLVLQGIGEIKEMIGHT